MLLPDNLNCVGHAADAKSAYIQVKMDDAQKLVEIQDQNVRMYGCVLQNMNDQCHGNTLRKLFLFFGQNFVDVCKTLMKDVDIEEPTSFFDQLSNALNRNANQARRLLDNATICLNPVFLMEQSRNYQEGTNLAQKLQRSPTTWNDMLENAWNGIANWQTRRQSNYTRFLVIVWTITKSKRKNLKIKVNCQKFAPVLLH